MRTILSNKGFSRPEFDEIREDINELAREKYGDDVDLSDSSIVGMLMAIIATRDDLGFKLGQAIYNSLHLTTQTGNDLDLSGNDFGIPRILATNSMVDLKVVGEMNVEIPEGTQFSTEDALIFETIENAKITIPTEVLEADDDEIKYGEVTIKSVSVESGAEQNVKANAITVQFEPIDGVLSVTNPQDAEGGTDDETDTSYRSRLLNARVNPQSSSENGIKTYLENNIAGAKQVRVISNRTMEVDKYNNPPKSTHIYVLGGEDQNVADKIFEILAAPANTVGTVSKTVLNLSGDERTIKFDRAVKLPIKVKVEIVTNDKFDTDNGEKNIKEQLKEYVSTLEMGEDVLFSKFFEYAWKVEGLSSLIVNIGTDTNLAMKDVAVDEFQVADLTDSDIEVVIND